MEFQFTRSSRKHRIGRGSAKAALVAAGSPELLDDGKLKWVGTDERDRELEIVGVPIEAENLVLIIHVMPTTFQTGVTDD
jgi:hypothetical protein